MEDPYYVAGFNYKRQTSHGIQDLHRGEDVVPTGSDFAVYPKGTIGTPIRAISDGEVLRVWDNDSVGGYHQAILVCYPDLGVDVLYGHVGRGTMLDVGERFTVWDVVAKVGNRYDAIQGSDVHTHVQVAKISDRSKYIDTLGAAFNNVAIDPRAVRLKAGEPDMPNVAYYGPYGPKDGVRMGGRLTSASGLTPNLACGDHRYNGHDGPSQTAGKE